MQQDFPKAAALLLPPPPTPLQAIVLLCVLL